MTDSKQEKSDAFVDNIIRGWAAFFLLGGMAVWFNWHGAAELVGLSTDGSLNKIIGGMMFGMAAVDFIVILPYLKYLREQRKKAAQDTENQQ
jgi:hypothetical protein